MSFLIIYFCLFQHLYFLLLIIYRKIELSINIQLEKDPIYKHFTFETVKFLHSRQFIS